MSARRFTRPALALSAATAVGLTAFLVGQPGSHAASTDLADDALVGRLAQTKDVDVGRKGPSVGDRFVFSENLSVQGSSERIGRLAAFCDVSYVERNRNGKPVNSLMQCIGTFRLPDGQISGQGALRWSDDGAALAITGGTGEYEGAVGTIDIEFVNDKKNLYKFDFGVDNDGSGILG